jgi:hypothetical protein
VIVRQLPDGSLYVTDSPAFINAVLGIIGLVCLVTIVLYATLTTLHVGVFVGASIGLILSIVAILYQKRTQFTFDAPSRMLTIRQRWPLGRRTLDLGFDDVSNIVLQTDRTDNGGTTHRVAIVTPLGVFALNSGYESNEAQLQSCANQIRQCLGRVQS